MHNPIKDIGKHRNALNEINSARDLLRFTLDLGNVDVYNRDLAAFKKKVEQLKPAELRSGAVNK